MRIIDISLPISEQMITYRGDSKPKIKRTKKIPASSSNDSQLTLGSHTGTHVDTGLHIKNKGKGVDKLPLNSFMGKCSVLDLTHVKKSVGVADLKKQKVSKGNIILLKTKNSLRGYKKFRTDFVFLDHEGADYLVKKKIKTLGVDYLSVQEFKSGVTGVHPKIINNMTLFEGLDLSKVKAGEYLFVGLPLRIKNGDGAPARALLIEE